MKIPNPLARWTRGQEVLLINAGAMLGSAGATSILGFAAWWLAARLFAPAEVGLASAAVALMALLATVSSLGLGTLLMGELPRQPERAGPLISTALLCCTGVGLLLGALCGWLAPALAADLAPLASGPLQIGLFSAGVAVASVAVVLDQALVGLLRGGLQLRRNIAFAVGKIVLLPLALLLPGDRALAIYALWTSSALLSLIGLVRHMPASARPWRAWRPRPALVGQLGASALSHHALNLTLQAPAQLLPLVVTATLSAEHNAGFYVAWMLASFVCMVPVSLASVLYSIGVGRPEVLAAKVRTTLAASLAVVIVACAVLVIGTPAILGIFGPHYAAEASWCLRIVALGALPAIVRAHFVAICRIERRTLRAALFTALGGGAELGCAAIGAQLGGLTGLALGWLVAVTAQSALMAVDVWRAAGPRSSRARTLSGIREPGRPADEPQVA